MSIIGNAIMIGGGGSSGNILWLYINGDECADLTGGWAGRAWPASSSSSNPLPPTVTKNADDMKISFTSGTKSGACQTGTDIDLSGYSTLKCTVKSLTTTGMTQAWTLCVGPRSSSYWYTNANQKVVMNSVNTFSIDVSGISTTKDVYIGGSAGSSACNIVIEKIWLEK